MTEPILYLELAGQIIAALVAFAAIGSLLGLLVVATWQQITERRARR